jgi:Protein of unknown function (DUF1566)
MRVGLPCALLLAVLVGIPTAVRGKPPSWDKVISPGQSRFKVLPQFGGEAVLDKETGLVWERSPSPDPVPWAGIFGGAVARCYSRSVGGRRGWRLPTVEEISSLIDPTQTNPTLATGHPFTGVQNDGYWSITSTPGGISAYFRNFGTGVLGINGTSQLERAWCVRGGHGFDAPPQ